MKKFTTLVATVFVFLGVQSAMAHSSQVKVGDFPSAEKALAASELIVQEILAGTNERALYHIVDNCLTPDISLYDSPEAFISTIWEKTNAGLEKQFRARIRFQYSCDFEFPSLFFDSIGG